MKFWAEHFSGVVFVIVSFDNTHPRYGMAQQFWITFADKSNKK